MVSTPPSKNVSCPPYVKTGTKYQCHADVTGSEFSFSVQRQVDAVRFRVSGGENTFFRLLKNFLRLLKNFFEAFEKLFLRVAVFGEEWRSFGNKGIFFRVSLSSEYIFGL